MVKPSVYPSEVVCVRERPCHLVVSYSLWRTMQAAWVSGAIIQAMSIGA
jgi:hypothetical protein